MVLLLRRRRPSSCLGFLLLLFIFCAGKEQQQRADAADASPYRHGSNFHRVAKPSYPMVTTPMFASGAMPTPMRPASSFPSLADANGGGVGFGGGGVGAGGGGGGTWCVASPSASTTALQVALDYACGYSGVDCSAIQTGGSCFSPDTIRDHASYAFNSYYQKNPLPTSCDFGGTATTTTTNPSSGSCQYPSSSGGAQTTMPPPSPTTLTPMTPTPMAPITPAPMTPTPTTPDTTPTTPFYGSSPPDFSSSSPPGSTSPPDFNDVGAAPTAARGSAAWALVSVVVAMVSLRMIQ